jgi:hypothetical protein
MPTTKSSRSVLRSPVANRPKEQQQGKTNVKEKEIKTETLIHDFNYVRIECDRLIDSHPKRRRKSYTRNSPANTRGPCIIFENGTKGNQNNIQKETKEIFLLFLWKTKSLIKLANILLEIFLLGLCCIQLK